MNPLHTVRRLGELAYQLGGRRKKLHRVAFAWSRNHATADDLVQETLTKALINIGRLRKTDALDAWLFQIMANCWRDLFRRKHNVEDIAMLSDDVVLASEDDHDGNEMVMRVRAAVLRLPAGQREVLSLIDLQGFTYDEVAEILDIPVGTVTSRVCRARETLRERLMDLSRQGDNGQVHSFRRFLK